MKFSKKKVYVPKFLMQKESRQLEFYIPTHDFYNSMDKQKNPIRGIYIIYFFWTNSMD